MTQNPPAETAEAIGPLATGPLYMVQLPVDRRRLFTFARDQGLQDADSGYVVHALLAALFGPDAPQPFALPMELKTIRNGDPATLPVLAYGHHPSPELQDIAQLLALPAVYQAVSWAEAGFKPMPARFPAGLTLGFEVRACPVVRLGRGNRHREPGSEVDAALAAAWAAADGGLPEVPGREAVYRTWLADQIAKTGGARLREVKIAADRRVRLFRRGARPEPESARKRPAATFQHPDIVFRGRLEVADPDAFTRWLARGVGRHRAFGFGMVLLRPA